MGIDGVTGGLGVIGPLDELIDAVDVGSADGNGHAVDPSHGAFLGRLILDRIAGILHGECRAVPGLADEDALVEEAVLLGIGIVPQHLDRLLVLDAPFGDLFPDGAHLGFRLIRRPHGAGFEQPLRFHVEAGGQHHGVRPAHAGIVLGPDIAVARHTALGRPLVGAPGDALGTPDLRQPAVALAEIPVLLADLGHGRVDVVDRHPLHIDGLQEAEVGPLRGAVGGGRAEVVALALGRLHLVEQFLVGANAGEVDGDAGLVLEPLLEVRRHVLRPLDDVEHARRPGVTQVGRTGQRHRAGRRAGLEQGAAGKANSGRLRQC